MLGAFTVLPKNPSILEVLSAWHSQPPLDNFWLWLPLTRTTSILLLICTERHTPMTKEISGFGRQTLKTKFMQVFVLNSGVKVGEGGGMEWDNLGKKKSTFASQTLSLFLSVFWMRYRKEWEIFLLSSPLCICFFILMKRAVFGTYNFRVFYSNIFQQNSNIFNSKSSTFRKEAVGIGTKPNNN